MQTVLIILSTGLFGLIIYFAFSPKSSRLLKRAALIALGFIGLAMGVCSIMVLIGPVQKDAEIPFNIFPDTPKTPPQNANVVEFIIFLVVFVFVIGLIVMLALRERRAEKKKKKPGKPPVLRSNEELHSVDLDVKPDEESFDIGLD
jgi:multisubunit Na+/H+ antiporter MnhB subunit